MKRNLTYFILYLFFMVSCSDDSITNTDKLVDIDITKAYQRSLTGKILNSKGVS